MADSLEIAGLSGQTILKQPGSVQGQSVVLSNLQDCEVYILDNSSGVEVVDCERCKIFIGPVSGSVIFTNVSTSAAAVAAQNFQIRGSSEVDIGLFSATPTEVSSSSGIRISCWMGAYAGLSSQFMAANLDPLANQWDQVLDTDAESNFGAASYELTEAVEYWEPPLDEFGPPENPVPAPDGTRYAPPADANGDFPSENGHLNMTDGTGAATLGTTGGAFSTGSGGGFSPTSTQQGFSSTQGSTAPPAGQSGDHPKVAAMMEKMQQRTKQQEADEASAKAQLAEKANQHLESFYQRRQAQVGQRSKDNRTSNPGNADGQLNLEGNTPWEKTLGLINFNFLRASAADKARFKTVLFSAKANNTPIAARGT